MANETKLEGFDQFQRKLAALPPGVKEEIDFECRDAASLWEQLAKAAAPKDKGRLYQNITVDRIAALNYEVTSPIYYSPYQEWGTGTRVSVPAELVAYALQFKGSKSVKGIPPHPYFFPQKPKVEEFLIDKIERIINTEH